MNKSLVGRMLLFVAILLFVVIGLLAYYSNTKPKVRDWNDSLVKSEQALEAAPSAEHRFYMLSEAAKSAAEVGEFKKAESHATELLNVAPQFRRNWNYGNAVHDGHMVLGRVALARGDRATARQHLLLAGQTPGSPQLNSFGPNMALAADLLKAGERETVAQYFDLCLKFWKFGDSRIRRWKTLARVGLPPDFGANLLY